MCQNSTHKQIRHNTYKPFTSMSNVTSMSHLCHLRGLSIGSNQHHTQCFLPLSMGENIALCAESIHGLTLPQCLRRPVPLPAEEACCGWRSYVRHHQEKFVFRYGLENLDQNSPMETKIIPDNNKPGLICPVQLHHELHLEM